MKHNTNTKPKAARSAASRRLLAVSRKPYSDIGGSMKWFKVQICWLLLIPLIVFAQQILNTELADSFLASVREVQKEIEYTESSLNSAVDSLLKPLGLEYDTKIAKALDLEAIWNSGNVRERISDYFNLHKDELITIENEVQKAMIRNELVNIKLASLPEDLKKAVENLIDQMIANPMVPRAVTVMTDFIEKKESLEVFEAKAKEQKILANKIIEILDSLKQFAEVTVSNEKTPSLETRTTSQPNSSTIIVTSPPNLTFGYTLSDQNADGTLDGGEKVTLKINVRNIGEGDASGVRVVLSGSSKALDYWGRDKYLGDISAGEEREAVFETILPYKFEPENANLVVKVTESRGFDALKETELLVAMLPAKVERERKVISRLVDVDDVPSRRTTRENTYAVIIGIEQYREDIIPAVDYARRDAEIMRSYLINVAGVPSENVFTLYDEQATITDIIYLIEDQLPMAVDAQSMVFIYYSGHGTHDNAGNAYLIPYNGKLASERFLYSLDDLNTALAGLPTENVVVMLDACFSGTGRSALASGQRPAVMAEMETETWPANLRVIAAAQGTQTAWDYEDVKHGLFTYYLLDGLRGSGDTDGDGYIEFGELYNYIHTNVLTTSTKTLLKRQEPVALPEGQRGEFRIVKVK